MSSKGAPLSFASALQSRKLARLFKRARRGSGTKRLVHLAALGATAISLWSSGAIAQCPSPGGVCATPGKDGAGGTLTGVVNAYYPGTTTAAAAATSITVGPARSVGAQTNIASGDLLLVIQMQGADINSNNNANYGDGTGVGSGYLTTNLSAGLYEFVKATSAVTAAAGGTINITGGGTGTGLINAYVNAAATGTTGERSFQVVRVPQYTTATLSSTLTAGAWDGSGGGILALDVSTTLTLGGTVSVDGLGFRGGAGQQLTGGGANNNTDYRNTTGNNYHGNKGEGIAGTPRFVINNGAVLDNTVEGYPNGSRARGAPGTAGGGGTDPDAAANDQNSGGGGGGNGGAGGVGGLSWFTLLVRGGLGGAAFAQSSACRIVIGGGGGSGTRNNDDGITLASSGSAGGGIVIIRTRFVQGTGTITANGANAFNNTDKDGGGGGGAGGTIIVSSLNSSLTTLTVSAHGGRGGDAWDTQPLGDTGADTTDNQHGPGGGGGGGVVFLSSTAASIDVTGGAHGTTTQSATTFGSSSGSAGTSSTTMTPDQIPGVFSGAQCSVTAVGLAKIKAEGSGGKVRIRWTTGHEADNLGFHLYREQNGQRVRITPSIVAGSSLTSRPGTILNAGWSYQWTDTPPENSGYIQYWLEDIDLAGKGTWHGPIAVEQVSEDVAITAGSKHSLLLSSLRMESSPGGRYEGPAELKWESEKLTPQLAMQQGALAGLPAVKISVRSEGWYQVTKQALVAAGLNPQQDPRFLQLFLNGAEVPISVTGTSSSYTVGFYGTGVDTQSTDLAVYWLIGGSQAGQRIPVTPGTGAAGTSSSFPYTIELRQRTIYFPGVLNGEKENFFGDPVTGDGPTDESFMVTHLDPAMTEGSLSLGIQGVTELGHRVTVALNGTPLGEIDFTGQTEGFATIPVSAGLIKEGVNDVTLNGLGGDTDVSLLDYIRLTYRHTYAADNNSLKFTTTSGQAVTVEGFSNSGIRVMDVTDPRSPVELTGIGQPGGGGLAIVIASPLAGPRTLFAFTADQAQAPAALDFNQPSSWRAPINGADLVIITRSQFVDNIAPLANLRKSQGLSVAVIDAADIYDEFSFGQKTPQAIRDFLAYAISYWKKPPRFVLLAGKASYDPKNYLGEGDLDLVPSKLIDTAQLETASDDWFVDFNNNGYPQLAIGRLPARTPQEMNLMVGKILAYENSPQRGGAVLVSDASDDFNFAAAALRLKPLLPVGFTPTVIDRGATPGTAKLNLLNDINEGQRIVNYNGHGTVNLWRDDLLTDDDALALVNGQNLPVFVIMTCLNGAFDDPGLDSVSESLLKAQNGGAAAVWASSGITEPGGQVVMNKNLYQLLFANTKRASGGIHTADNGGGNGGNGGNGNGNGGGTGGGNGGGGGNGSSLGSLTIGEAAARAKTGVTDQDVRRTWILFGDPSMRLKQ
jgi:hypothetical protein